jgi:hypothetical protein
VKRQKLEALLLENGCIGELLSSQQNTNPVRNKKGPRRPAVTRKSDRPLSQGSDPPATSACVSSLESRTHRQRPDLLKFVMADKISLAEADKIRLGKSDEPRADRTFVSRSNGLSQSSFPEAPTSTRRRSISPSCGPISRPGPNLTRELIATAEKAIEQLS